MNTFNKIILSAVFIATAISVDTHAAASSRQPDTRSKRGRHNTAPHVSTTNKTQRTNRSHDAKTSEVRTTQAASLFDRKKIMGGLFATGLALDAAIAGGALSDHSAFYSASQILMALPLVYYAGKGMVKITVNGVTYVFNKLVRRQPFNTFVSHGTSLEQERSESDEEQDFGSVEELAELPGSSLFDGAIGNAVLPLPLLPSSSSSNLPVDDAPKFSDFFLQQTSPSVTLPALTEQEKSAEDEQLPLLLPVLQEGSDLVSEPTVLLGPPVEEPQLFDDQIILSESDSSDSDDSDQKIDRLLVRVLADRERCSNDTNELFPNDSLESLRDIPSGTYIIKFDSITL
ncbi:hypothetical protein K2W90_04090 [Candidatus Babeliales bacterium]|nr:hypothetical protein [Candidatus Babeliales bacterium]